MHSHPCLKTVSVSFVANCKSFCWLAIIAVLLTLDFERYTDGYTVPLNCHRRLNCAVRQPLEISVGYPAWFFVLPIDHMTQLQIDFKFVCKFQMTNVPCNSIDFQIATFFTCSKDPQWIYISIQFCNGTNPQWCCYFSRLLRKSPRIG